MIKGTGKKHYTDIMFLMVLFLVFTMCSISVLVMAISSYKGVVYSSEKNSSARIASSYIREVVHQNDRGGNVSLSRFDGVDAVVIELEGDAKLYIYEYGGYLRELNALPESGASCEDGAKIMPVTAIEMTANHKGNLIDITIADEYENSQHVSISVKSSESVEAGEDE